jgi:bacterioferritin-associated ferredoxin
MFVCVCNGVTERQIEKAIEQGATSLPELTSVLGIAAGCGTCADYARQMLGDRRDHRQLPAMHSCAA